MLHIHLFSKTKEEENENIIYSKEYREFQEIESIKTKDSMYKNYIENFGCSKFSDERYRPY